MRRLYYTLIALAIFTIAVIVFMVVNRGEQVVQEPTVTVTITDGRFVAPVQYRTWVYRYCAEYGVPVDMAIRLAYEESRWDETAMGISSNGTTDHGLYQLNSRYHDPKTTEEGIRLGIEYLGKMIRESATMKEAVCKYNAGPNFYKVHGYWPKKTMALAKRVTEGGM